MNSILKNKANFRPMAGLILLAATLFGCVGCAQPNSNIAFQRNLTRGAEAIQSGNLDMADNYISSAKDQAETVQEKRQAQSLESLSKGARNMLDGDVATARQQWAAIRQPQLNLQVRNQAKKIMDIDVPAAPTESYESEVK